MCGIIGGLLKKNLNVEVINESLNAIYHRGPDDAGIYQNGNVFLGNRRLSIIDLSGGHQPVFNEDNSIVVVFNGEIYNYLELISLLESKGHVFKTKSDTECLVHLWEEHGTEMCKALRGMFAFAIWDTNARSLFLARDRFGKKPLYYCEPTNGEVLFASELKSLRILAEANGERFTISDQSIYDYLSLGVVPQPETVFQGVYAIPPASWMLINPTGKKCGTYWRLDYNPHEKISYREALDKIRELIKDSVRLRLRSDVPVGIFLSGGLDSAVVATEASSLSSVELESFTVSMNDPILDESFFASLISKRLGIHQTIIPLVLQPETDLMKMVACFDQPYSDSSAIPTFAISEETSKHLKVVLTGDGGDEIFAGYRRHLASLWMGWFQFLLPKMKNSGFSLSTRFLSSRRSKIGFAVRFLRSVLSTGGERYLSMTTDMLTDTDKKSSWVGGTPHRSTEQWIESVMRPGLSVLNSQMDTDIRINLLSDLLVKMDMATMAHSLEARSPLLDHKLAEFIASLPSRYLCNGFNTKTLLRDAYKGLLPQEIIDGPKKGFEIPMESFLQKELRPLLLDTVVQPNAEICSYLSHSFVTDLIHGKILGDRNKSYIIFSLLVLELWLRQFKASRLMASA